MSTTYNNVRCKYCLNLRLTKPQLHDYPLLAQAMQSFINDLNQQVVKIIHVACHETDWLGTGGRERLRTV